MDWIIYFTLFAFGIIAYIISTLSGGGGSLILIPILNFTIGSTVTAPVLNLGSMIGRPSRLIIFWKNIRWKYVLFYAPSAIIGSIIAAWLFTEMKVIWLQLIIAVFLISTVFQYSFGKKARSFPVKDWYFILLGFVVSMIGTFTGGLGPVLNPFYLNAGVTKEELIGTKTANSFLMGASQIGSYTFFGLLDGKLWIYGLVLGLGATVGNIVGKRYLKRITEFQFRQFVIAIMVISGILMLLNIIF